jgi:hypothetical protein
MNYLDKADIKDLIIKIPSRNAPYKQAHRPIGKFACERHENIVQYWK